MKNKLSKQVKVLPGVAGIKSAYEKSLKAKRIDTVCLSRKYAEVVGDYFDRDYAPRLFGSVIETREILPDTKENREYVKAKDQSKNQVKFLKIKKPNESDMMIFGDKAVLVSYNKENPFALVIKNQELVRSFKSQFEELWQGLA